MCVRASERVRENVCVRAKESVRESVKASKMIYNFLHFFVNLLALEKVR